MPKLSKSDVRVLKILLENAVDDVISCRSFSTTTAQHNILDHLGAQLIKIEDIVERASEDD